MNFFLLTKAYKDDCVSNGSRQVSSKSQTTPTEQVDDLVSELILAKMTNYPNWPGLIGPCTFDDVRYKIEYKYHDRTFTATNVHRLCPPNDRKGDLEGGIEETSIEFKRKERGFSIRLLLRAE